MKKIVIFWLALLLVFAVAACDRQGSEVGNKRGATKIGAQMPGFSLPSAVDGVVVDSGQFKGKVILAAFFATWCSPCRAEVPSLIELQKAYGSDEFSVIGLSVDRGGLEAVKDLIDSAGINYPVLMAAAYADEDFGGISGIPDLYVVDRTGKIVERYLGGADYETLDQSVKTALNR